MHKMQNVLGKLPEAARNEVKQWLQAVRDAPTLEEGRAKAAQVIEIYEREYPAAMKSFADDLEACPPQAGEPGTSAGAAGAS
jgi:putative transposase